MAVVSPFQLLEVNVISAQDLEPVCRKMKTYAVAWVHPERKLTTRVDTMDHTNPTWNDKFVFRVNDAFLYNDTSAVMIEMYAMHWFRDIHVGTVRVMVGNLIAPSERLQRNNQVQVGMKFVALQVRRRSGRPQGILNIGVALLDSSKRSMPLYMQMGSSAVGYRHLMGEEEITTTNNNSTTNFQSRIGKSELRRTKSDSSSIIGMEALVRKKNESMVNDGKLRKKGGSMVNGGSIKSGKESGKRKTGSLVNGSDSGVNNLKGTKGKSGSMVNGLELKNSEKKHGSWVTQSEVLNLSSKGVELRVNGSDIEDPVKPLKPGAKNKSALQIASSSTPPPSKLPAKFHKYTGFDYEAANRPGRFWTNSELGPSPSEVAANVAANMQHRVDEAGSSIIGWSLDGSIEGLESKLERWRTDLPILYDTGDSSYEPTIIAVPKKPTHRRRHIDGGSLFSCFSNICGCQCSITIGGGPPPGAGRRKGKKERRTPSSFDTSSFI